MVFFYIGFCIFAICQTPSNDIYNHLYSSLKSCDVFFVISENSMSSNRTEGKFILIKKSEVSLNNTLSFHISKQYTVMASLSQKVIYIYPFLCKRTKSFPFVILTQLSIYPITMNSDIHLFAIKMVMRYNIFIICFCKALLPTKSKSYNSITASPFCVVFI